MIWIREKVKYIFESLICTIGLSEPGGDWDIPGFRITPIDSKEWISVMPFKDPDEEPDEKQNNCEVYAIEVRTNGDCEGGLQTEDEEVGALYGQICARLSKEGFYIIPHYNKIF